MYLRNDTLKDIKITMRVNSDADVIVRLQNIRDWIDQNYLEDTQQDFIQFDLGTFMKQLFDAANAKEGFHSQYHIYFYPLALNGLALSYDPHRVRAGVDPPDDFWIKLTNQDIAQYRVVFKK